mgnify:CR=1 FL=1
MCGRFTLTAKPEAVAESFGLDAAPEAFGARYNIAPTQRVAVVANREPRELEWFQWGLVPFWAKDPAIGQRMINARAEGVAEKPSFRAAFRKRRCLVVADGFHERKREVKRKTPMHVRLASQAPFAFAGLWESWRPRDASDDTEPLRTCTIITTTPNRLLAEIHDRMPVILSPGAYDLWLDPQEDDRDRLEALLAPCDPQPFEAFAVSTFVNAPSHDGPQCIEPA